MEYNPNEEAIKELVEALEEKRKAHLDSKAWTKMWYQLFLGILILFLLLSLAYGVVLSFFFMAFLCAKLFIQSKNVNAYTEKYKMLYKETFVKPFVQFFYPKVTYQPGKFSTSNNIQTSFLYDSLGSKEGACCEDGFRGKTAEGLDFTMMEIQHELDENTDREFFVSLKLPDKDYEPVFVAPKSMITPITEAYHKKEKSLSKLDAISEYPILKQSGLDPSFEKKYLVYSPSKEDAKALLTPSFLALIEKLEKQWTEAIRFSLVKDTVHIAFSSPNNFFEVDEEQAISSNTVGEELFNQLSTYLTTVEALSVGLHQMKLPSKKRIPLPKNLELPKENWDNSAYDHFIDN